MSERWLHLKLAATKAAVVLVPSYIAAYVTGEMVWVVPTLAAAGFFAGTIDIAGSPVRRRVDEDEEQDEFDAPGDVATGMGTS